MGYMSEVYTHNISTYLTNPLDPVSCDRTIIALLFWLQKLGGIEIYFQLVMYVGGAEVKNY